MQRFKGIMTLSTTDQAPIFSLSQIKRKKREAQRQLELLTCRINHIENKQKEHTIRATSNSFILEQRFKARLDSLQLKRMLKESKQKLMAEQHSRTLVVRRQKQELKEGRDLAHAVKEAYKKRISEHVRTVNQLGNKTFHETTQQMYSSKKNLCLTMRRTSGMAIFRRKMKQNDKKARIDDLRRKEAMELEKQASHIEQSFQQLYQNLELEQQKSMYCRKINERLGNELLEQYEDGSRTGSPL